MILLAAAFSWDNLARVETWVWVVGAAICLGGSLGVVLFRNPVHNALSLVATLFGVAVLFIVQKAYFLAAIQVIVYAGAIVVLFLFVIMLLGVDRFELPERERNLWQRPLAVATGLALAVGLSVLTLSAVGRATGARSSLGRLQPDDDVAALGRVLFTDYIFAFEATAVLLTIAVVGAVVMVRRAKGEPFDLQESLDASARLDEVADDVDEPGGDPDEVDPVEAADEAGADEAVAT